MIIADPSEPVPPINKILSLTGRAQSGLMPPEEATQINLTFQEKLYLEQSTQSFIEGDPSQVEIGILKSSERYETNEIGIVTNCYYFEDRLKSYELVSKIFNQTPVENVYVQGNKLYFRKFYDLYTYPTKVCIKYITKDF